MPSAPGRGAAQHPVGAAAGCRVGAVLCAHGGAAGCALPFLSAINLPLRGAGTQIRGG